MGIITNLFILGFFIIALVIGFSTFSGLLSGLIDEASGFFVDTELKPKPQGNEIICDLRVKVNADLDETLAFTELFIRIIPESSHNWTWFECFAQGDIPLGALIDFGENIQPLAFLIGDLTETGCITIVDATDPTQKVTPNTQPNLCQTVEVGEQFETIPIPFDVSTEFVIKNIPLREYILEITYDNREIAVGEKGQATSLTANEPYKTRICDQFSVLQGSNCVRTG
jgi:hypothetical protein